jgi:hypothetical protein
MLHGGERTTTRLIRPSTPLLMQGTSPVTRRRYTSSSPGAFLQAVARMQKAKKRLYKWIMVVKSSMQPVRSSTVTQAYTHAVAGLIVLQRNYLEVYPYDKWEGKVIPNFEEGEQFVPTVCELKDGQTSSPSLLTEADLVTLMDKNGIGVSPHILSSSAPIPLFAILQAPTLRLLNTFRRSSTANMSSNAWTVQRSISCPRHSASGL